MRIGKLSQQMLDESRYPKCLDEGFAEASATDKRPFASPLYWSVADRRRWNDLLVLWIGFLIALVGSALYSPNPGGTLRLGTIIIGSFAGLMLIIYWLTRPLYLGLVKRFERHLADVLFALHPRDSERPVHLMTLEEVKERAVQCLISIAYEILRLEKAGNAGMPVAEDRRSEFREKFDLFKKYGLTGDGGYEGCFNAAKQKLLEETYVSPHAATPVP